MPFTTSQNTNLREFRQLIGDVARSYLFEICIPFLGDTDTDTRTITCLARSTILPKYTIEDIPFEFQKSTFHMGGRAKFDTWNVTFLADSYHKLRHRLLAWQSIIFDPTRQVGYSSSSYKRNGVTVKQLDRTGSVITAYEFKGLFPSEVGEIQVDNGNTAVEEFNVTFTYDYYTLSSDIGVLYAEQQDASSLIAGESILKEIKARPTSDANDVTDIDVAASTQNQDQGQENRSQLFGQGRIGYSSSLARSPDSIPSRPGQDVAQTEIDISGPMGFAGNQPFGEGKINTADSSNKETILGNVLSFNPYNALGVPYAYRWMPPVKGLASLKISRRGIG